MDSIDPGHAAVLEPATPVQPWPPYLPALDLDGERFVQPQFGGLGLANIAPTALAALGAADRVALPPLDPRVLPAEMLRGVRLVLLLVADGLGHLQLLREVEAGNAPTLGTLLRSAERGDRATRYAAVTSVFPTTTVAALGSLNSGVTPAEHGLLGYTLYLDEFETVAEMIRWGPLERAGSFADTKHGGADPSTFFWVPTLYQRLDEAGVSARYVVNPSFFAETPLSKMWHQGATYVGYAATSSVSVLVPRLVEQQRGPAYIYAYWPTVDTVTHVAGPSTEEHGAEVAIFDFALRRLLDRLPGDGDTLLLLTADHGHIGTSAEEQVLLNAYPDLVALFAAPPAGERRATYLYARPGEAPALVARARERLRNEAVVLSRREAVSLDLFGPAGLSPAAARRVGDVLLLPRDNLQIAYQLPESDVPEEERPKSPPPFCGLHGGLTPEEALVPLLALRL